LCAEKAEGCGFLATVFTIENEDGQAFLKREEEIGFDIAIHKKATIQEKSELV
jgi:hypothetical protein